MADLTGIAEGFSLNTSAPGYGVFTVNVSAEKLKTAILKLACLVQTPACAILEIPTSIAEEDKLRADNTAPFHRDVYYWEQIRFEDFHKLFERYAEFFVEDGQLTFGFASHQVQDEVYIGRYKLITIYAESLSKYRHALQQLGYPRREPLRTVYNNFQPDAPGSTEIVRVGDKTIYDIVPSLVSEGGFHFVERRADK